jgi:hypothetical protein
MKRKDLKTKQETGRDELRPEYNFDYSKAVRGKYYKRLLKEGANVVVLEPDVVKAFAGSSTIHSAPHKALKRRQASRR